jgi:hypothetical protein
VARLSAVAAALFALALIALGARLSAAEENVILPPALAEAIRHLHPGARIVAADEVLGERCGPAQQREQIFRADFNGDRRQDYAVLLRIGEPAGKPDEALRTLPLWGVVFLANRDGRFRPFVLFKDEDAMFPSRRVLFVHAPGPVHHGAHPERVLTLKHPAVGSMLCESSVKVYYWVGLRQTFRSYLTRE